MMSRGTGGGECRFPTASVMFAFKIHKFFIQFYTGHYTATYYRKVKICASQIADNWLACLVNYKKKSRDDDHFSSNH